MTNGVTRENVPSTVPTLTLHWYASTAHPSIHSYSALQPFFRSFEFVSVGVVRGLLVPTPTGGVLTGTVLYFCSSPQSVAPMGIGIFTAEKKAIKRYALFLRNRKNLIPMKIQSTGRSL